MQTTYSLLEDAAGFYSDFHKDVYGVRPRHTAGWSLTDFERAIDRLRPLHEEKCRDEAEAEAAAAVAVEARIAQLIAHGAADRDAAIRWLADAEGASGDMQYLCFGLGLPYGYFGRA